MSSNEAGIRAIMILDVIGRPPEYLTENLEKLTQEISKEKGVKVIMKEIKEPTLMKDQKDLYTTFAEVEVEVEDVLNLAILLFKYMPAHLDVVSPEIIALSNGGWNDILNELTRRLHAYDEIARMLQREKVVLLEKIKELGGDPKHLIPKSMIAAPDAKEKNEDVKERKGKKK